MVVNILPIMCNKTNVVLELINVSWSGAISGGGDVGDSHFSTLQKLHQEKSCLWDSPIIM